MAEGSGTGMGTNQDPGTNLTPADQRVKLPSTDELGTVQARAGVLASLFKPNSGFLYGKLYRYGLRDEHLIGGLAARLEAAGRADDAKLVRDMLADPSLQLGSQGVNELIDKAVSVFTKKEAHDFDTSQMRIFLALKELCRIAGDFYGKTFPGLNLTSASKQRFACAEERKVKAGDEAMINQWLAAAVKQPATAAVTQQPPVGALAQQQPGQNGTPATAPEAAQDPQTMLSGIWAQLAELRQRNVDTKDKELAAEQKQTLDALYACMGRVQSDPALAGDRKRLATMQDLIKTITANYNSLEKMRNADVQQAYANMQKEFGITRQALRLQQEIDTQGTKTDAANSRNEAQGAQANAKAARARAEEDVAEAEVKADSNRKIAAAQAATAQSDLRAERARQEATYVPQMVEMEQYEKFQADWTKLVGLGIRNLAQVEGAIQKRMNDRNQLNVGRVTARLMSDNMRDANNWTRTVSGIVQDWGKGQGWDMNHGAIGAGVRMFGFLTGPARREKAITQTFAFSDDLYRQRRAEAEKWFVEQTGVSPQFMAHFRTVSELHGGNIPGGNGAGPSGAGYQGTRQTAAGNPGPGEY